MSLLRTIMEHSTLSFSGGGSSNNHSNTQTSMDENNATNTITPTTTPTVTQVAGPGDSAVNTLEQTSNNTVPNNHNVNAELIAIRNSKEQQRRRERRERRIRRQRRGLLPVPTPEQLQHYYHHNLAYGGGTFDPYSINAIYGSNGEYGFNCGVTGERGINMPDILNSHIPNGSALPPPPYSTLPGSGQRGSAPSRMPQSVAHRPPHVPSPSRGTRGWRHAIFPTNRSANNRRYDNTWIS